MSMKQLAHILWIGIFSVCLSNFTIAQVSYVITDFDVPAYTNLFNGGRPLGVGTATWTQDTTYILDETVYVNPGDELSIGPGTIIKGRYNSDPEKVARLVVSRGAKIFADGTAAEPIIFTAEGDFGPDWKAGCEEAEVVYISDLPFANWYNGWGPVERDKANGEEEDDDTDPNSIPILMNGKEYEKGLGVHSSFADNPLGDDDSTDISFVRINLNGEYQVFKSDVGPQDTKLVDGGERTFLSILFRVLVDGAIQYTSQVMTPGSRIEYIELDVSGAKTLDLQVLNAGEFRAKNGNRKNADHGNWGNARLEKCVSPISEEIPNGTYVVENKESQKVWDIALDGAQLEDGANLQQWEYVGATNQQFEFLESEGGDYKIRSLLSAKFLDAAFGGVEPGTNIHQWSENNSDAQVWSIFPVGDGYYQIINKLNGLYIDLDAASTINGANIKLWENNGLDAQKWRLRLATLGNPIALPENVDPRPLDRSLWGGVVILGNAPVNTGVNRTMSNLGEDNFNRRLYGGNVNGDNSGRMTYVSIRHGGGVEERKVNGLTLAAVGDNTRIENIEVISCYDDGIEICGGTVNTKFMSMAFNGSDGFDIDEGYAGKGQFWFSIQNENVAQVGESLLEGAFHNGRNQFANPTRPTVYNATIIGANIRPSHRLDRNFGLFFRDASSGIYKNCIIAETYNGAAIEYDGGVQDSYAQHIAGNLVLSNNMFWDIASDTKDTAEELFLVEKTPNQEVSDIFASAFDRGGNTCNSPEFRALNPNSRIPGAQALDPRPRLDGKGFADKGRALTPNDGFFDTSVNYKGAFGTDLWVGGWTALSSYGFLGSNGGNPDGAPRLADLTYESVSDPTPIEVPAEVEEGGSFTLNFPVFNIGELPSEPTLVNFSIGSEYSENEPLALVEVGGKLLIPHVLDLTGVSPGTKELTVEIDPSNAVREGDEANNIFTQTFILKGPPTEGPDIQVTELAVSPLSGSPNSPISLSCKVTNIGESDAGAISVAATIGSQALTLANSSIASLAAGASLDFETTSTIPSGLAPGTYQIEITLSLNGEENTGNNSSSVSFMIDQPGEGEPSITLTNFPPFHPMEEGIDTEVSVEVADPSVVSGVKFFYREISRPDQPFSEGSVSQEGSIFTATFSDGEVGPIGINYYFEVTGNSGDILNSNPGYTHLRYNSGLTLPTIRTGDKVTDYQILSIPLNLNPNSFNSVFEELGDDENETIWKFMRFNGNSTQDYAGPISPGQGYWLLSTVSKAINSGLGSTVQVTPSNPFTLSLNPGGSDTQIGNPYNFNLSWPDIVQENGVSENELRLKTFNGGWVAVDRLNAFQGAFVQNNSGLSQLRIPVQRNTSINTNRLGKSTLPSLDEAFWYVPIHLKSGDMVHQVSRLGMHPESSEGFDSYDMRGMPRFDQFLDLNFVEPGHSFERMSENFVNTQDTYSWKLEIESNLGLPITISWENAYFGENDRQLWLEDLQSGQVIDMRTRTQMSFSPQEGVGQFLVHFGDRSFVSTQVHSLRPWIEEPYPNPVEDEWTIVLSFPGGIQPASVNCELYTITGQRVLEKEWILGPGKNEAILKWSFDKDSPNLSEGIYMYLLTIQTESEQIGKFGKVYFRQ